MGFVWLFFDTLFHFGPSVVIFIIFFCKIPHVMSIDHHLEHFHRLAHSNNGININIEITEEIWSMIFQKNGKSLCDLFCVIPSKCKEVLYRLQTNHP